MGKVAGKRGEKIKNLSRANSEKVWACIRTALRAVRKEDKTGGRKGDEKSVKNK